MEFRNACCFHETGNKRKISLQNFNVQKVT